MFRKIKKKYIILFKKGQSLLEYLLLAALIATALIAVIFAFQDALIKKFEYIEKQLSNSNMPPLSKKTDDKLPSNNTPKATPKVTTEPKTAQNLDSSKLPSIAENASVSEIKKCVSKIYDSFPEFSKLYETDLGMTKNDALAFMYGVISNREGKTGKWDTLMSTTKAESDPSYSTGPFQAASTNYSDSSFANEETNKKLINNLGLPNPKLSDSKKLNAAIYTGMKRLAAGAKLAMDTSPGKTSEDYLKTSMSYHVTGQATGGESDASDVIKLMNGYKNGEHLTDNFAY